MPSVTEVLAKREAKKAARAENAAFNAAVAGKQASKTRKKKYVPSIKRERLALWATIREFVKWRDGDICRICNANPGQVRYHVIPANEGAAAKWDLNNIVWACASCNNLERRFRARYVDVHKTLFGVNVYQQLRDNANRTVQYRADDFREMREKLQAMMAGGVRS